MNIDILYEEFCNKKSDINEHLKTLKKYASEVDFVTEMGVRTARSTTGFIAGRPHSLISYDLKKHKNFPLEEYKKFAKEAGVNFNFIVCNVLQTNIQLTDLLFIDTYHSYSQLKRELKLHSNKVRKYIILHDTVTFGEKGEDGNKPGLLQAVNEFVSSTEWKIKEHYENNNGLTILEK
jgi:hypothetical protein